MTAYNRGDTVLVSFPFTDLTTTKIRPALVLSSGSFHQIGPDIILAGITSQIPKEIPFADFMLSMKDQTSAGLPKPSLIRLGKIVTLDRWLIRKRIGHLPDSTMSELTLVLHKILLSEKQNESPSSAQEPQAVYKTRPAAKRKVKAGGRKR